MQQETTRRLAVGDLLPPLGALAGIAASMAPGWAPAASETSFLAWLAGGVLLATSFLSPRAARLAATGVVVAAWVLPPGASRGLAVTTLLVLALATGAWERRHELSRTSNLAALALGVQLLLRAEDLVGASAWTGIELLALPLLLAIAVSALERATGERRLLPFVAAVIALAGAVDVALVVALWAWLAALSWRHLEGLSLPRVLPLPILALLCAVDPPSGALALAAALLLVGTRPWQLAAFLAAIAGAVWAITAGAPFEPSHLLALPILLPAALAPTLPVTGSLAGLLLTVAGLGLSSALLPAAPLLVLTLKSRGKLWPLQRVWSLLLLAATSLLATYPWLRDAPLSDALGLFGLAVDLRSAVLVGLAALCFVLVARRPARRGGLVLIAATLLLFFHLPTPTVSLVGYEPLELPRRGTGATLAAEGRPTRVVAVGASASNSLGLERGTPLARVRVSDADGRQASFVLRAGIEVGEWAARRPDLRDREELREPAPFVAWSVPGFFGRSFRSLHELEPPLEIVTVEVERDGEIAEEVGLRVEHLDLRP